MRDIFFIINSPPFLFLRTDLYSTNVQLEKISPYIKAISDAFFLSNNFRKYLYLDFYADIEGERYIISFEGKSLKYLGPSFFSAAHLLLRARNHIKKPQTKEGKLTPGITVKKESIEDFIEKFSEYNKIQIIKSNEISEEYTRKVQEASVFFFGFNNRDLNFDKVSFGPLNIDEQVIITNYNLER